MYGTWLCTSEPEEKRANRLKPNMVVEGGGGCFIYSSNMEVIVLQVCIVFDFLVEFLLKNLLDSAVGFGSESNCRNQPLE